MKNRIASLFASVIAGSLLFAGHAFAQTSAAPNDEAIVAAVKSALAAKPELKTEGLKITSKSGDVTIAGNVESGKQLYNIADTAQKVAGVKSIYNEMIPQKD